MKKFVGVMCVVAVFCMMIVANLHAKAKTELTGIVNVNTATVEQLSLLPGVGESKAKAIIEFRAAHPFKTVDELTNIKGIGPKMIEKMRAYVAVSGETTAKALKVQGADKAKAQQQPLEKATAPKV
jgi:comEA protein